MNYWKDIKAFDKELVNAVIEISMGTKVKTEIDENGEYLVSVRELKKYKYPFNYGFIPCTLGGDGDALDAVVLGLCSINPITIVKCRVIGTLMTIDKGEQDDKVFLIPDYYKKNEKQEKKLVREAKKFLKRYKYPYHKDTIIGDFVDKDVSLKIIKTAEKEFENKFTVAKSKVSISSI